jgi:large subunit ribosomal protein L1
MSKSEKNNTKVSKIAGRSLKYSQNVATINSKVPANQAVDVATAVELLSSLEAPKFKNGATLELHLKLNIDSTKSDQLVRGSVVLPHGTGKEVRIAAFVSPENEAEAKKAGAVLVGGDELVEDIKKKGKVEFDVAIAEPAMMKKLAPIARVLGVAGVMPNPKTQTVGDNVVEMISTILKGKVDYKNDKTGNVHVSCGKLYSTFELKSLIENVEAAIDSVQRNKPEAIKKKFVLKAFLATSQSPSIRVI